MACLTALMSELDVDWVGANVSGISSDAADTVGARAAGAERLLSAAAWALSERGPGSGVRVAVAEVGRARGSGTGLVERAMAGAFFPAFMALADWGPASAGVAVATSAASTTKERRKVASSLLLTTDHPPGQT